jgi:hypothetical protein
VSEYIHKLLLELAAHLAEKARRSYGEMLAKYGYLSQDMHPHFNILEIDGEAFDPLLFSRLLQRESVRIEEIEVMLHKVVPFLSGS